MLERPNISDEKIRDCLATSYALDARELTFLPIGNDVNTAAYQVIAQEGPQFYLKLRRDDFSEAAVLVPQWLHDRDIREVIAPLPTTSHKLWTTLEAYTLVLFPFVDGRNGFSQALSDQHWIEFGTTLKALHSTKLPAAVEQQLPRETYAANWREKVMALLDRVNHDTFAEPTAAKLAQFLKSKQKAFECLIERAALWGATLADDGLPLVVCHGDIHAANVLIDARGRFFIVDWDTLILAPKERDLMFIGGGIGGVWNQPEEAELFYTGYGQTQINLTALAYYRCERIVEDIAAYCAEILLTDAGGPDRENGLREVQEQFLPGHVVEIAMNSVPSSQ